MWMRMGEYLDFLCLRVKSPDLEPGVLTLPLPSWVTWTKRLTHTMPQYPQVEMGIQVAHSSWSCCED